MTATTWGSLHTAVLPPNNRTHHRKTNPMRSKNCNTNSSAINEEEEESDEEYIAKKDGTSNSKDLKSNNRANAIRSKHSVTEQRRRCKINERFQILRDLMPHGDHKKDTASFLSEVIEHVQLLQEKVQKYEGSYQACSAEPTKLMAWASLEPDANQDVYTALGDPELELAEKVPAFPSPFQIQTPLPVHTDDMFSPPQGMASDLQSTDCPITSDNRQDEHTIEGGTINISSTYSQELLATLTQALHNSGLDLSKARISLQIDLGKQANHALASDIFHDKEHENASCNLGVAYNREGIVEELLDQARD